VLRTPLIRLQVSDAPAAIYLKLENVQPIGSFKLRGADNAMAILSEDQLARSVFTASAGNMAQGVAWNARRLGILCTVIVPDHAPQTKLAAIARLGARIIPMPFAASWQVLQERNYPGLDGIAAAFRALKPKTRLYGCEVATAAPLAASLAAGALQHVTYTSSFVDGIGSASLMPEMWSLASSLLDGALISTLAEISAAICLLAERNRMIAEGAGAAPVAAALSGQAGGGPVGCVVSGGNIDAGKFARIRAGEVP
jgi:threonine dehydratase